MRVVTVMQTLRVVAKDEPTTIGDLAVALEITPASARARVLNLVTEGLLSYRIPALGTAGQIRLLSKGRVYVARIDRDIAAQRKRRK